MFTQKKQQLVAHIPTQVSKKVVEGLIYSKYIQFEEKTSEKLANRKFSKEAIKEALDVSKSIDLAIKTKQKLKEIKMGQCNKKLKNVDFNQLYPKIIEKHDEIIAQNNKISNLTLKLSTLKFLNSIRKGKTLVDERKNVITIGGICERTKRFFFYDKANKISENHSFSCNFKRYDNKRLRYIVFVENSNMTSDQLVSSFKDFSVLCTDFPNSRAEVKESIPATKKELSEAKYTLKRMKKVMKSYAKTYVPNINKEVKALKKEKAVVDILSYSEFSDDEDAFIVRGIVKVSDIERIQRVVSQINKGNEKRVRMSFIPTPETREMNKQFNTKYFCDPLTAFYIGMMCCDYGYGILFLLLYIFSLFFAKMNLVPRAMRKLLDDKKWMIIATVACTVFSGCLCSQYFGANISFADSMYSFDNRTNSYVQNGVTMFGFDRVWFKSINGQQFIDDTKFRIIIIFGILLVFFSLFLQLIKHLKFDENTEVFTLLIPKIIITASTLGYFMFLLIFKCLKKNDLDIEKVLLNIVTLKQKENKLYHNEEKIELLMLFAAVASFAFLSIINPFVNFVNKNQPLPYSRKSVMFVIVSVIIVALHVFVWKMSITNRNIARKLMQSLKFEHEKLDVSISKEFILVLTWLRYALTSIFFVGISVAATILLSLLIGNFGFSYLTGLF